MPRHVQARTTREGTGVTAKLSALRDAWASRSADNPADKTAWQASSHEAGARRGDDSPHRTGGGTPRHAGGRPDGRRAAVVSHAAGRPALVGDARRAGRHRVVRRVDA